MEAQYLTARLTASVPEFSKIWAFGVKANLHLFTSRGLVNVDFFFTISNPSASFPPPPPPPLPRQHGPSDNISWDGH